jgi:hypothetical protein
LHDVLDILLGVLLAIALMRVQRDLYLVGMSLKQSLRTLTNESTIGGKNGDEPLVLCHQDEVLQMLVHQRFAHQMKV